jgi:hypothetical protein
MTATEPILFMMGGPRVAPEPVIVEPADAAAVDAYRALRRAAFVDAQGLFDRTDRDDLDDSPATVVLVARDRATGAVAR